MRAGGSFDAWDLEARGGILGGARIITAIEDIAPGAQLARIRVRPHWFLHGLIVLSLCLLLALAAAWDQAWLAAGVFALAAAVILARGLYEAGTVAALVSELKEAPLL